MVESPSVSIALATYNGERYLSEFLDSLASQTLTDLEIVASDDASRDDTVALLRSYSRLPVRVIEGTVNQGVRGNFEEAIGATEAPYVFFADQDDVWESDKIERMTSRLRALEAKHGSEHPALVFCDLRIVDADLREIQHSYFIDTGKTREATEARDYIISNHVPGCAIAVNRALITRALPMPDNVYLHDWWFMLVATIFGAVDSLPDPLVRYRQHGSNTVGFPGGAQSKLLRLLRYGRRPLERVRARREFYRVAARIVENNVTALLDKFADDLPPAVVILLDGMASPHWLDRWRALQGAKTGESTIAKLAITAQMWADRPELPDDR